VRFAFDGGDRSVRIYADRALIAGRYSAGRRSLAEALCKGLIQRLFALRRIPVFVGTNEAGNAFLVNRCSLVYQTPLGPHAKRTNVGGRF
jgi:hypothetical protein